RASAIRVGPKQDMTVVMKVTDDWGRDMPVTKTSNNFRNGAGGFVRIDCHANKFGACQRKRFSLFYGGFDVRRIRVGHGLDGYRMFAANPGAADIHRDRALSSYLCH